MATEFKLKDYTYDTDISDEMIAKSSPINDYKFEDNIQFEASNETDSFTPTLAGGYQTYGDFECIDPTTRVITMALGSTGLFFVNPDETGAGNITPFGVAKMAVGGDMLPNVDATWNLGSASFQWNKIYLVNAPIVSSDIRFKKNIRNLGYGMEQIMKLRPVIFDRDDSINNLGLIAQEVKEVIPEVVSKSIEDRYGVSYEAIIPVLIKGMHEQQAQIDELITEVGDLRSQLML